MIMYCLSKIKIYCSSPQKFLPASKNSSVSVVLISWSWTSAAGSEQKPKRCCTCRRFSWRWGPWLLSRAFNSTSLLSANRSLCLRYGKRSPSHKLAATFLMDWETQSGSCCLWRKPKVSGVWGLEGVTGFGLRRRTCVLEMGDSGFSGVSSLLHTLVLLEMSDRVLLLLNTPTLRELRFDDAVSLQLLERGSRCCRGLCAGVTCVSDSWTLFPSSST